MENGFILYLSLNQNGGFLCNHWAQQTFSVSMIAGQCWPALASCHTIYLQRLLPILDMLPWVTSQFPGHSINVKITFFRTLKRKSNSLNTSACGTPHDGLCTFLKLMNWCRWRAIRELPKIDSDRVAPKLIHRKELTRCSLLKLKFTNLFSQSFAFGCHLQNVPGDTLSWFETSIKGDKNSPLADTGKCWAKVDNRSGLFSQHSLPPNKTKSRSHQN